MKGPLSEIVTLVQSEAKGSLSPGQKLFTQLIKKIDQERQQLGAWQSTSLLYQEKYIREFVPLVQVFDDLKVEMVKFLDQAYGQKTLSKGEKTKLSHIICDLAGDLIAENEIDDLKPLYNKHSKFDFDAEIAAENEAQRIVLKNVFGIDPPEHIDLSSPEHIMAYLLQQTLEKGPEDEYILQGYSQQHGERKRSSKKLAAEAKQREEAQRVSQSVREVYLKLARDLHPDREQEANERDRKTELMQRVNVAYGNEDLLGLLELQLEVEQIDQTAIKTMSEDRLKNYNKVLKTQFANLQHEVREVEYLFRLRLDVLEERRISPQTVLAHLQKDLDAIQGNINSIKTDLLAFQNVENIKKWLKRCRMVSRAI